MYCTNKIALPSWKTNETLFVFEAQTFIFAVLYKKNKSFQPKVLYCTKKKQKNNVSRPLTEDQPASDQLSRPQDQET